MPQTRHVERHFTAGETVRDIVIGMSDGLTVPFALSNIAGGWFPRAPYIAAAYLHRISVPTALLISVGLTVLALLVFGFIKGRFTGTRPLRSALQTALIGSLAAGAAFLIARAIS